MTWQAHKRREKGRLLSDRVEGVMSTVTEKFLQLCAKTFSRGTPGFLYICYFWAGSVLSCAYFFTAKVTLFVCLVGFLCVLGLLACFLLLVTTSFVVSLVCVTAYLAYSSTPPPTPLPHPTKCCDSSCMLGVFMDPFHLVFMDWVCSCFTAWTTNLACVYHVNWLVVICIVCLCVWLWCVSKYQYQLIDG